MQTFLPYPNFDQSAKCLDRQRLGKQRVEVLQILKALLKIEHNLPGGWHNHPAVLMWQGHEQHLIDYGRTICKEWIKRGYRDTCLGKIEQYRDHFPKEFNEPSWLGDPEFHASHRSNLLRKQPDHYSKFGWTVSNNLEYKWPVSI